MSQNLTARVALVTGAGSGIGRAVALALAASGARVAVHFNSSADEAKDTLAAIERLGSSKRDARARGQRALAHQRRGREASPVHTLRRAEGTTEQSDLLLAAC